jgi:hypothetical protein
MAAPAYAAPPGGGMTMEPAELHTVRSMLKWARILALIIAIVDVLAFIGTILLIATFAFLYGVVAFYLPGAIFYIAVVIVSFLIWMKIGEIQTLVDQGQFQAAKDKSLIWMVLGFIFGWIIVGILILLAYTKFDTLINYQRQTGYTPAATMAAAPGMTGGWFPSAGQSPPPTPPAGGGAPPPSSGPVPPSSGSMGGPGGAGATGASSPVTCPKCGQPATYIPQYNRYYCYTDQQYV